MTSKSKDAFKISGSVQEGIQVKFYMGLDLREPVLRVSDQVILKRVCSATETSYKIEILVVASLDVKLSNQQIINVQIRLR